MIHHEESDYISLTDMAGAKGSESRAADIIKNWLRNRYTIEFLGIWEMIHNPDFKVVEFDHFRKQAGLPTFEWREANPDLKGNIRDYATMNQLICLSNLENLNAVFINEGLSQRKRLERLNQIAIQQMKVLEDFEERKVLSDKN